MVVLSVLLYKFQSKITYYKAGRLRCLFRRLYLPSGWRLAFLFIPSLDHRQPRRTVCQLIIHYRSTEEDRRWSRRYSTQKIHQICNIPINISLPLYPCLFICPRFIFDRNFPCFSSNLTLLPSSIRAARSENCIIGLA